MYPSSEKRFLAVNLITIITLFVLIFAGGIVRSTGSGMGCPDWPKCFGAYVPPTHVSQLPKNYQQKFISQRKLKNERFAKTLDVLGYGELANKIRDDKSILQHEEFNALKTWTEYINRLIGVICGFLLIVCVLTSLTYLRSSKRIFFLSLFNVLLVGFQGWLGSIVVSTNLLAWVVTVHMLVALLIVAICIYTFFKARTLRDDRILNHKSAGFIKNLAIFAVLLTLIQIIIGTEVREQIDAISSMMNNLNRSQWVRNVGLNFEIHRDLAFLVTAINILLFFIIRRSYRTNSFQLKYSSYSILLIIAQIITGITLSYWALPPVAQSIHILLASLVFGSQFYLMLLLKKNKLYSKTSI
ncbi:MAG: COX15/CtaA family protein [Daejeonella sp.]